MRSLYSDMPVMGDSVHPLVRLLNWCDGGTGLTNFYPKQEPIYLAAIKAHGDPNYVVAHAPCEGGHQIPGDYSLHRLNIHTEETDSGPFWETFKAVREANVQENPTT